jgi:hypothetical protein
MSTHKQLSLAIVLSTCKVIISLISEIEPFVFVYMVYNG